MQWDYPLKSVTPSNKITICTISINYSLRRLTDLWICGREVEWFVIKRWQIFPTDAWHQLRFSWICLELLGKGSNHLGKASSRNFSGFLSPVLPYLSSFSWHQSPPPKPHQTPPVMKSTRCRWASGIVGNCFPNREVLRILGGLKPIRHDLPVIS